MEDEKDKIMKEYYDGLKGGEKKVCVMKKWLKQGGYSYEETEQAAIIRLNVKGKLQLSMLFNSTSTGGSYCETGLMYDSKLVYNKAIGYERSDLLRFNKDNLKKHIVFITELFNTPLGEILYKSIENNIKKK